MKGVADIINELTNRNKPKLEKEIEPLEKEVEPKEILNDLAKEAPSDNNIDDIDKLKKLINRISETKPEVKEKPIEKEEVVVAEKTIPLAQEPEPSIKQVIKERLEEDATVKGTIPLAQKLESSVQKPEPHIKPAIEEKPKEETVVTKGTIPLAQEPKPSIKQVIKERLEEDTTVKGTIPLAQKLEPSVQKPELRIKPVIEEKPKEETVVTKGTIPLAQEPKPSIKQVIKERLEEDTTVKGTIPLAQKLEPSVQKPELRIKPVIEEKPKEETVVTKGTIPLAQEPKPSIKQVVEKKPVKKEETTTPIAPAKKSFWGNISEKLKKSSDSEKINALSSKSSKKNISDIKTNNKAKEFASQSGILQDNKDQKEESEKESLSKKAYYEKSYMSPDERLIHGKQKYYSSVSKRIKLREEKDELEDLRDTAKIEKQKKIVTKEEEYKKLKKSIIQKYNIKLFSLPWKKIVPVAIIVLALTGFTSYYIFSKIKPPTPPTPPELAIGSEIEEFLNIRSEITITEEALRGFNNLEADAMAIFDSDKNIEIIKLFVVYDETDKKILSLHRALDAIGITDVKEGINNLPDGFLRETTNNYNLFLFKTEKSTLRYGIAIKINNEQTISEIMGEWEKEGSKNKKMTTVLKPLFGNDRNFEEVFSPLSTATYQDIRIRYVSLTDKETALDYFIHKNILVFATSKDSTFLMIDLLASR